MAEAVTTKTVVGASGVLLPMKFHKDSSDNLTPIVRVVPTDSPDNGLLVCPILGAASNNAQVIKASPGVVYAVEVFSVTDTAPVYLKFYDLASTPTPASSTIKWVEPIPGITTTNAGGLRNFAEFVGGVPFSVGIAVAIVAGIGATDNTSISANRQIVNVFYK